MIEKTILSLIKGGDVLFKYPLKAYFGDFSKNGEPVFVVSVPKRNFKRAVKRNLLKRRIREAYRLEKASLSSEGKDIMIVYIGEKVESYEKISESVSHILKEIGGLASGQTD